MKTLNFVSIALLSSVLVVSTAFGKVAPSAKPNLKNAEASVRDQIASTLSGVADENRGVVYVFFNASPKVGFEVLRVTGSDKSLAATVKSQLENGSISVPSGLDGIYYVKVSIGTDSNVVESVSSEELLRNTISETLSKVNVPNGTVTLYFTVKGNKLSVKKAEGADKSLVSMVKNTIDNTMVDATADLNGNYQIDVKF